MSTAKIFFDSPTFYEDAKSKFNAQGSSSLILEKFINYLQKHEQKITKTHIPHFN